MVRVARNAPIVRVAHGGGVGLRHKKINPILFDLPTYWPTDLPTYQTTKIPTYGATDLPTYQPTKLPI